MKERPYSLALKWHCDNEILLIWCYASGHQNINVATSGFVLVAKRSLSGPSKFLEKASEVLKSKDLHFSQSRLFARRVQTLKLFNESQHGDIT